jgi:sugar O-acyltransferase (sialic acid O-acetyltransferase NeuD family)
MNGAANALAVKILSASGTALGQAGLLLPNNPQLIVAMLASLKAHKAYVPLDCNFPQERLRTMLDEVQPCVLITDDEHLTLARNLAANHLRILNMSGMPLRGDTPNPGVPCDPLERAYILYTSGSTGRPKGIEFLHRNLLHTTMCLTNELFFAPSDRVSWLHSPSFGSSVVDIYCCLTNGATLFPWDVKKQGFTGMAEWIAQNGLTTLQWIPSAFRQFLRTVPETEKFEAVRMVMLAGEPLTVREVELFRRFFAEGSHLVNQVGTGESYNYHLYALDNRTTLESANVAAGYPVSPERRVLILDDARRELPQGSTGEIAIQSEYMAAGYWRDEELTRAKFIRLEGDETPVYLTGDLGEMEPDGCLVHLGRKDFQVKIRGCRVEVAEIDRVLAEAPGVADAATWIARNRLGEDQLVGYVVPRENGRIDRCALEDHLRLRLPAYMLPAQYVVLDEIPVLPTGKADRKALPNPFAETKPEPPIREIVALFEELLELEDVKPDCDFLDSGGDSLLSAVLIHRIHEHFGAEVRIDDFLLAPTPRGLAELVATAAEGRNLKVLPPPAAPRLARAPVFRRVDAAAGRSLIVIGAGACGRETYTWALQAIAAGAPWHLKGFLDDSPGALAGYSYAVGVLGSIQGYAVQEDDVFIGGIGSPRAKLSCYSSIAERGGKFITLVHPLANVGLNVQLGAGVVLAPFSSVTSDVRIGSHVSIGAFSNAAHDTVIGDWCQISSHCGINGAASLGEGVFLGSHVCVAPGISIGDWAYAGAGSVIVRKTKAGVKLFGNPAAPIGSVSELRVEKKKTSGAD